MTPAPHLPDDSQNSNDNLDEHLEPSEAPTDSTDDPDTIIEAFLHEALGDRRPPDLKSQILAKLEAGQTPELSDGSHVAPIVEVASVHNRAAHRRSAKRKSSLRQVGYVLASIAVIVATVSFLNSDSNNNTSIVNSDGPTATVLEQDSSSSTDNLAQRPSNPPIKVPSAPPEALAAEADTLASTQDGNVNASSNDDGEASVPNARVASDTSLAGSDRSPAASEDDPKPARPTDNQANRKTDSQIVQSINELLKSAQDIAGISAGTAIDDSEWCERVHQRLLGRSARAAESTVFLNDDESLRRQNLLDRILDGQAYQEELASYWAGQWSDWLLATATARPAEQQTFQVGLRKYLQQAFTRGDGYDQISKELIVAAGSNDPDRNDYNPATNFLLATLDTQGFDAASVVCQSVLGRRMRCAQCHDDTSAKLSQDQFLEVASTFAAVKPQKLRLGRWRLTDSNASETASRATLADTIVASDRFREAAVNRFWAQLLQYGFSFPVDDLGPHNRPAHPRLVELVSSQFEANGYDVRKLLRWIASSNAFDRTTTIDAGNLKDYPDSGSIAYFSRDYFRPSVFSAVDEGLAALLDGHRPLLTVPDANQVRIAQARRVEDQKLNGSKKKRSQDLKPRRYSMGQLMPVSYLRSVRRIAESDLSDEQKLEHTFWMTKSRAPTKRERDLAEQVFAKTKGNNVAALERISWVLLNVDAPTDN